MNDFGHFYHKVRGIFFFSSSDLATLAYDCFVLFLVEYFHLAAAQGKHSDFL